MNFLTKNQYDFKMKRVKINKHQVGLVFEDETYIEVLKEGKHWLKWGQYVITYNITDEFVAPCEIGILLEDEVFRALVHLVEVSDNEMCILFRDGLFQKVLVPGRYIYWKSMIKYDFQKVDLNSYEVSNELDVKLLKRPEIMKYHRLFIVEQYREALLLVDGHLVRKLQAGSHYFWQNGQVIQILDADMRAQQMEISGQEILTKDKAAVRVNFYLQYKIVDIEKALLDVKDMSKQLYMLVQLAIREYVGTLSLDELLAKKEEVKAFVMEQLRADSQSMGVEVLGCGIRDIILPGEIREIMNQVLVAEKTAQANTILRREETAATRSLLNTAKLMESNAMLMKLKEMEYMEKIADKVNSISLSGGSQVIDQLRQLFVNDK